MFLLVYKYSICPNFHGASCVQTGLYPIFNWSGSPIPRTFLIVPDLDAAPQITGPPVSTGGRRSASVALVQWFCWSVPSFIRDDMWNIVTHTIASFCRGRNQTTNSKLPVLQLIIIRKSNMHCHKMCRLFFIFGIKLRNGYTSRKFSVSNVREKYVLLQDIRKYVSNEYVLIAQTSLSSFLTHVI